MALNQEVWLKAVQEVLFPANEFYRQSTNHTQYVNYKTVRIPNAGSLPSVLVNNTSYPLGVNTRTDVEKTYDMSQFQLPAMRVDPIEQAEFSYDKMMSIVKQMSNVLNDAIAQQTILNWSNGLSGTTSIIDTTGSSRAANISFQTGTRKAMTFANIVQAHQVLNAQNVPQSGRKMLVSAGLYTDLVKITEFQYADALMSNILSNGSIGRIFGADVYMRGEYGVYENNSGVTTTSTGATSNDFAIIWHPDYVSTADGNMDNSGIKLYIDQNNPTYQSDVISALVRHGSSRLRDDNKGLVIIREQA